MNETWTVQKVLTWTSQRFEQAGIDSPRLTAEVLLAHSLEEDRVGLYLDLKRPLEPKELSAFRELIQKRLSGEPTQYLTGIKHFYNRPFRVDQRVMIPRPETELLVESILSWVPKDRPARILDLCTGSGCIAITLAAERPLAEVWAIDLSAEACQVATANAEALGVVGQVRIVQGDLFEPLGGAERFDVIASNPPYLATEEIDSLAPEVKREPRLALDGGPGGLSILPRLVQKARSHLLPGGSLALEIAPAQGAAVLRLLQEAGYQQGRVAKDLERRDRFAFGTQP